MGPRLAALCLLGCLILWGANWLGAEDASVPGAPSSAPTSTAAAVSPFLGRVLAVYSASDPEAGGAILVEAKTTKLGEQTFLVGRCPDLQDPSEWRSERTVWLSLADVAQIVEFDNLEQYRKAIEKAGLNEPGL